MPRDDRAITEIAIRYRIEDQHYEVAISPRAVDAVLIGERAVQNFNAGSSERALWTSRHAPYFKAPRPILPVGGLHELPLNGDGDICVHYRTCRIICMLTDWLSDDFNPGDPFAFNEELPDIEPNLG